jgi:tetratricopeptide (TPR) repeat protein
MRLSLGVMALVINLVCAMWVPAHASPANANAAMDAGIREFRAGAFEQALADFLNARHEGVNTPVLHYNLGATYYKLGRDKQAATEFRSLLSDAGFGNFARYNLGLIARRQGRAAEARDHFSIVAAQSANPQLGKLARAELRDRPARPSAWRGFLEADAGYDDNVALAGRSSLLTPSGRGSAVVSALVGGSGRLTGNGDRGLHVAGTLYAAQYPSQTGFNLLSARGGPEYRFRVASWGIQTGAYLTHLQLGSSELETLGMLNLRGEHALGSGTLRLDYRLQRIDGGPQYRYLSGWQNQFGVRTSWGPGPFWFAVGYRLALNRRDNLVSGNRFFSVSPTRHQIDADLRWNATPRSVLYVRGSYWRSRYDQPNVFLQAGTLVAQTRKDDGEDAELGVLYRLTSSARLGAEYGYRRNDSNMGRYAYTSNRYLLTLQYVF